MAHRDSDEMRAFMLRLGRAMVKRARHGDVDALVALRDVHRELNELMGDAARGLNHAGIAWEAIAASLGTTKQAVHKRWAEDVDVDT